MIWFVVAVCVVLSFVFSGAEAGILSLSRVRLRHRVGTGDPAAIRLSRLAAKPERLLVTVLLVTNAMNICAVVLTTRELVQVFGDRGYLLSFAVCLPLYLFLFEALPKTLFRQFPYRALAALSRPLQFADTALAPLLAFGTWIGQRLFPIEHRERRKLFAAREEFKQFASQSERAGLLTAGERAMMDAVVDFRGVKVRDSLIPIDRVTRARADEPMADLVQLARDHQLDDVPVESAAGEIVGVVTVIDVLLDPLPRVPVHTHMRRILAFNESQPGFEAVRRMRAARARVAAVTDADGKTIGIVKLDALVRRMIAPDEAGARG
jgi:putative hemolysin